jgi:hypothetical protein
MTSPVVALLIAAAQGGGAEVPRIEDNSFLMEEAYNQEAGVVQHISTLLRAGRTWTYGFTQEWPLGGQRHQLSYSVALAQGPDVLALNYRHQLMGLGTHTAFAPRISFLVPTHESVGTALQLNLPVSVSLAPQLVTHLNAGITAPRREKAVYNAGASLIWLAHPNINLMLETVWSGDAQSGDLIVNPAVRWAHNVGSLQIVPGVSFPDGRDVLFYLSFEHPFTRQ